MVSPPEFGLTRPRAGPLILWADTQQLTPPFRSTVAQAWVDPSGHQHGFATLGPILLPSSLSLNCPSQSFLVLTCDFLFDTKV